MSNDPKPNPTKPAPVVEVRPDYGKTIPIKVLTFFQPHPNLNAKTSISAEAQSNKGRVSIEFIPSLRHHRVEIQLPGEKARTLMISEGHVAGFEPLT